MNKVKEKKEILEKIHKLVMEKLYPERTVIFKGFYKNELVEAGRIVYKAGGFDIKERIINKEYDTKPKTKKVKKQKKTKKVKVKS